MRTYLTADAGERSRLKISMERFFEVGDG